jgi:tetratricopeptide (TPR) repeat protein
MKKTLVIILSLSLTTFMLCYQLFAQDKNPDTADPAHIFLAANQAYKEGRYEQAAALYENLLALEIINGNIFYNLGNSYLKAGKIGRRFLTTGGRNCLCHAMKTCRQTSSTHCSRR